MSSPGLLINNNSGQAIFARGSGPVHAPQSVSGDYIAGDVINVLARPEVAWPLRVGLVPQLADCFQPRSGPQNALATGSAPGDTTVVTQTQVLTGLGGNGKSQLAAARARELWDGRHLDLLVWITAASRDALLTGYAQVARSVGLLADPIDLEQAAAAFLSWAESTGKRWLVVLDDVSDPAHLTNLWPSGPSGRVLITTRRHDKVLSERSRAVIDVGLFTEDEALAYLTAKLDPAGNQPDWLDQAADLAADLGLLPLALAQAAAVMAEQGWTCAEYRAKFSDQRLYLADLLPRDALADDYASGPQAHQRATIATTWALSIEAADRLAPEALALPLLQLASYLDPNGIPVSVFLSEPNLRFLAAVREGRVDAKNSQGIDAASVRQALGNLARLSLIALDALPASATTVRIHALVQRAVRDTVDTSTQQTIALIAASALLAVWPEDDYLPENSDLVRSLRAGTAELARHAAEAVLQPRAHWVLFRAGTSFLASGHTSQAAAYWESLTQMIQDTPQPQPADMLTSRGYQASAYEAAGRLDEALPLYEANLADSERLLGSNHHSTLSNRNNLALAYRERGRLPEALRLYEITVSDLERLLGAEHPDTLAARHNFASAYRMAGQLNKALSMLEANLAVAERVLSPVNPNLLAYRNSLAEAYGASQRLVEALPLLEANLADAERILGSKHPNTLTSRNNLADAYRAAGRIPEALRLFQETLADSERLLGREHPDTIGSRNNLAWAYQFDKQLDKALPLFEENLSYAERAFEPKHPGLLTCRNNLAEAYRVAGQLDKALPLLETNLIDSEQSLGLDHPNTLSSCSNLAKAYRDAGRVDQALPLFKMALQGRVRALGPEHPETLASRENFAAARAEAERVDPNKNSEG